MGIGRRLSKDEIVEGLLAGDRLVLARAITLVESTLPSDQQLAAKVLAQLAQAPSRSTFRLGITGVPGVGKSTFIEAFGQLALQQGHRLAILAVDPSSPVTRGSILGDKTRMDELSRHPHVFVRPSAAGSTLGGITLKTRDAIVLCEAAGYDFVIVETVGVGQSEINVAQVTDFFLLMVLGNAGDELQGIKRGIMEMADAVLVHKADGDHARQAQMARLSYVNALQLLPSPKHFWAPPVLVASSLTGQGLPQVWDCLGRYRDLAQEQGFFAANRKNQHVEAFHDFLQTSLLQQFYHQHHQRIAQLEQALMAGEMHALQAALQLLPPTP